MLHRNTFCWFCVFVKIVTSTVKFLCVRITTPENNSKIRIQSLEDKNLISELYGLIPQQAFGMIPCQGYWENGSKSFKVFFTIRVNKDTGWSQLYSTQLILTKVKVFVSQKLRKMKSEFLQWSHHHAHHQTRLTRQQREDDMLLAFRVFNVTSSLKCIENETYKKFKSSSKTRLDHTILRPFCQITEIWIQSHTVRIWKRRLFADNKKRLLLGQYWNNLPIRAFINVAPLWNWSVDCSDADRPALVTSYILVWSHDWYKYYDWFRNDCFTWGFRHAISLRSLQKFTSEDRALFSSILPTVKILSKPPWVTSWIASRYDSILSSLTSVDLNSSAAVRTSALVTGWSFVWLRQVNSAGATVSSAVNISIPTAHFSAW